MLIKKDALKNFTNHTEKTPMLNSPFNKTASPQYRIFIKKILQHHLLPPLPPSPPPKKPYKTSKGISLYTTPPVMSASGERQNLI